MDARDEHASPIANFDPMTAQNDGDSPGQEPGMVSVGQVVLAF